MEREFHFSEKAVAERKKLNKIMYLIVPIAAFFTLFFTTYPPGIGNLSLELKATVFGVTVVGSLGLIYFLNQRLLRTWLQLKIRVTDEGIESYSEKNIERVPFTDINQIKISKRKNSVAQIRVFWSGDTLNIFGLEDMDDLAEVIQGKSGIIPGFRKYPEIFYKPSGAIIGVVIALIIVGFVFNQRAMTVEAIMGAAFFIIGTILIFRPMSSPFFKGPLFKKFLKIFPIYFILLGGWLLVGAYSDYSQEDVIRGVIIENVRASNEENLSSLMATLHEDAPELKETEDSVEMFFRQFDVETTIEEISVLNIDGDTATARVIVAAKTIGESEIPDHRATNKVFLKKSGEDWKISGMLKEDIQYIE